MLTLEHNSYRSGREGSRRSANSATTGELTRAELADKPTGRVEARGIEQAESSRIPKNLKLSLRGSVEIQAQHRPDQLNKTRTESARDRLVRPKTESVGTDRIRRFCTENRMTR